MDFDRKKFESVFSKKVKAGRRRTYFFDVRKTRGEDYYLTITESTKRFERDGYERHKLFLYKEDFNRFVAGLEETVNHIKQELLPDYDYDEYTRRHQEYEARKAEEEAYEAGKKEKTEIESEPVAETNEALEKSLGDVIDEVDVEVEEENEPVLEEVPVTSNEEEPKEEEVSDDLDDEDLKW